MTASATPHALQALHALLPIRDRRDRVVGYVLSASPADGVDTVAASVADARRVVEDAPRLARLVAKTLLVPVTPELLRDNSVARHSTTELVWLLATSALDDAATRRAVERLAHGGFHFALDGFPEGEPLPPVLGGSTLVLDAARTAPVQLEHRIGMLLDAGLRPMVRGVDDRTIRRRLLIAGAGMYTGRHLTRGAATTNAGEAQESGTRALRMLVGAADGRPNDGSIERLTEHDATLTQALLRAMTAATAGVRGPRTIAHALVTMGRDVLLAELVGVTARLLGDAAGDTELATTALRRALMCEELGNALDPAPHPRTRAVAGLVSLVEHAFAKSPLSVSAALELPPSLEDLLTIRATPLGRLLDVIEAFEHGWWDDVHARCRALAIAPAVVSSAYIAAWRSARETLGLVPGTTVS